MFPTFETTHQVACWRGTAPLLLSVPHSGWVALEGPDRRALAEHAPRVFVQPDLRCADLGQEVARSYAALSGSWPYVVIAQAQRRYVDPNRDAGTGYPPGNTVARRVWETYQDRLRACVDELRSRFGARQCLLLDLHGAQVRRRMRDEALFPAADPGYGLLLGSLKGSGVRSIVEGPGEPGEQLLYGPMGLRTRLHGVSLGTGVVQAPLYVWPRNAQDPEYLRGLYLLETYGRHRSDGINALQLEHSRELRLDNTVRQDYARCLAQVVWEILQGTGI